MRRLMTTALVLASLVIACGLDVVGSGAPLDASGDGGADGGSSGGDSATSETGGPADGSAVDSGPRCTGSMAYCDVNGKCFSSCSSNDPCPGKDSTCSQCNADGAGPVVKTCGDGCPSSNCTCNDESDCTRDTELCNTAKRCVICSAADVGKPCKGSGETCRDCGGGRYKCTDSC